VGLPLTMAEQETSVRVTRAAKKRAATATADEQAPTKKRVVLGELPNLSNVIVPANPGSGAGPQKPKCKTKTKKVTKSATTAAVKPAGTAEKDTNSKPDDPQMCEPYVSEIYEYLHKMEVSGPQLLFRLVC
jgi:cyclin A